MTPITLTLELHHNNRVISGLYERETTSPLTTASLFALVLSLARTSST